MEPITCREVLDLLTEYLEAALPPQTRARVERHLGACDGCTRYLDQLRTTIRVMRTLDEDDVPSDVRERLLVAFRSWRRTGL